MKHHQPLGFGHATVFLDNEDFFIDGKKIPEISVFVNKMIDMYGRGSFFPAYEYSWHVKNYGGRHSATDSIKFDLIPYNDSLSEILSAAILQIEEINTRSSDTPESKKESIKSVLLDFKNKSEQII